MSHHLSFKDLPEGGEKFEVAKASKLVGALGLLGVLGIVGSAILFITDTASFSYSWLFAIFVCFTMVAGGCFWILLHNASNSGWGVSVRRLFENLGGMAPYLGVLALPLCIPAVQNYLWPWMVHHRAAGTFEGLEEAAKHNPHLHSLVGKFGYLNIGFWYFRFFFYFVVLSGLAYVLRQKFIKQEADGAIKHTINARQFSCLMLFPFALTITFAAVDWVMALDYNWFSTMWGVYIFAGSAWSSMALMILVVSYLRSIGYLQKVVTLEHYHLMGKLLFCFTVFWAYIAFSQYFLIWYANIPEETRWYLVRNTEDWRWVSIFIVVGHFVAPFVLLLSQPRKKNMKLICAIAIWVLFMHVIDLYWNIIPQRGPTLGKDVIIPGAWIGDIVALCAVFGTLGFFYFRKLGKASLYAWRDPRLMESVNVRN